MCERERECQTGTLQTPKPQNNLAKKQAIKVDKGKDKAIVQSGSNEDTATVATLERIDSSGRKFSQRDKRDEGLREGKAEGPRPNTPSGFHEYPNSI